MRKVLMLLFISFSSFSQSISFDDIKTINSKELFDRFLIENNFDNWESHIYQNGYGKKLKSGNDEIEAHYQIDSDGFQMQFYFSLENNKLGYINPLTGELNFSHRQTGEFDATNDYKFILNQVKSQCEFYKIGTRKWQTISPEGLRANHEVDFSCYTCPSSKYRGKICFTKGEIRINDKYLLN